MTYSHKATIYGVLIEWNAELTAARATLADGRQQEFTSKPGAGETAHWQALQFAKRPPAAPVDEPAPVEQPAPVVKRGK